MGYGDGGIISGCVRIPAEVTVCDHTDSRYAKKSLGSLEQVQEVDVRRFSVQTYTWEPIREPTIH